MAPLEKGEGIDEVAGLTMNALSEDFELTTTVELSISCKINEPHDCMVVFYLDEENLEEIGRTEIQKATASPNFVTTFPITYSFEKQKKFRFDMYGMQNSNLKSLLRQQALGSARFNIHEIVCSADQKLEKPLSKGGSIMVFSEELSRLNHKIKMKLAIECKNSSGVYSVKVSRVNNGRVITVYVSEGVDGIPCSNFLSRLGGV